MSAPLTATRLALPEVLAIHTRRFADARGAFIECWRESDSLNPVVAPGETRAELGIQPSVSGSHELVPPLGPFVQDNASISHRDVLRGLHFQWPHPQGKLVTVLRGAIVDVAVDVRRGSPTFGRSLTLELGVDGPQLWIPPGFAHGFLALEDDTVVIYKCTHVRVEAAERRIIWNDPTLAIAWPTSTPRLSDLDARAPRLVDLDTEALPLWPGAAV